MGFFFVRTTFYCIRFLTTHLQLQPKNQEEYLPTIIINHFLSTQAFSGEGLLVGVPHICVSVCAHLSGQQAGLRLLRDQ